MPSYVPSSKDEVKEYVRGLTGYADDPDEVTSDELDTLVNIAQLRLHNKVDVDDTFVDDGVAQALVGVTAILTKARVENYSIDTWSIGDQTIETTSTTEDAQLSAWNELVNEGLDASPQTSSTADQLRSTTTYMQDHV